MATLTGYYNQLSNETQQSITFDSTTFIFKFVWDDLAQEQYDQIQNASSTLASSDPLYNIETKVFTRNYDYIDYYTSISSVTDTLSGDTLPYSIYKVLQSSTTTAQSLLSSRISECTEYLEKRNIWKNLLRWRFSISKDENVILAGYVQPGAIYTLSDNSQLWFELTTTNTEIGKDDLSLVQLRYVELTQ